MGMGIFFKNYSLLISVVLCTVSFYIIIIKVYYPFFMKFVYYNIVSIFLFDIFFNLLLQITNYFHKPLTFKFFIHVNFNNLLYSQN